MSKRAREESFSPSAEPESIATDDEYDPVIRSVKFKPLADSDPQDEIVPVMQCSLPPHHRQALSFDSIEAFEIHYRKDHSNRCSSCDKNFPSAHFLSLHLDEHHNPLRAELEAKGEKTYGCFVEDCDRKCSTPQKRRLHLIDKHLFPKSYNFRVISSGIDRSTSMLTEPKHQRRRVSTTGVPVDRVTRHSRTSSQLLDSTSERDKGTDTVSRRRPSAASPTTARAPDSDARDGLDDLTRDMSALRFIPSSIRRQNAKKDTH